MLKLFLLTGCILLFGMTAAQEIDVPDQDSITRHIYRFEGNKKLFFSQTHSWKNGGFHLDIRLFDSLLDKNNITKRFQRILQDDGLLGDLLGVTIIITPRSITPFHIEGNIPTTLFEEGCESCENSPKNLYMMGPTYLRIHEITCLFAFPDYGEKCRYTANYEGFSSGLYEPSRFFIAQRIGQTLYQYDIMDRYTLRKRNTIIYDAQKGIIKWVFYRKTFINSYKSYRFTLSDVRKIK